MKFQIPVNITIHCSVCGEKLSAVMYEPPDYDLGLCVEPCKTCGLTKRAADGAKSAENDTMVKEFIGVNPPHH